MFIYNLYEPRLWDNFVYVTGRVRKWRCRVRDGWCEVLLTETKHVDDWKYGLGDGMDSTSSTSDVRFSADVVGGPFIFAEIFLVLLRLRANAVLMIPGSYQVVI